MDVMEVINAILDGDMDDDFSDIAEAIQQRKKDIGTRRFSEVRVGDTVRMVGGKPVYLRGATGTVKEKRITKVTVEFPTDMPEEHDPYRKFRGRSWIMPATMFEKVEDE